MRIKCIVTYDLYGLISHKRKTITLDVLRTWSHYILNYGYINIMAKKPRLEVFSRLHIIQTVNKFLITFYLALLGDQDMFMVHSSVSKSFFLLLKDNKVWLLFRSVNVWSYILPNCFYSFDNILTSIKNMRYEYINKRFLLSLPYFRDKCNFSDVSGFFEKSLSESYTSSKLIVNS